MADTDTNNNNMLWILGIVVVLLALGFFIYDNNNNNGVSDITPAAGTSAPASTSNMNNGTAPAQ